MNYQIPVSYNIMPQEVNLLSDFLKSVNPKKNTMFLFSKGSYELIKSISFPFGEQISPVSSKKFVQLRDQTYSHDYFSFIPMYCGEWFYLENFESDVFNFKFVYGLPSEIKLITLENEFNEKITHSNLIETPYRENPLNCIMYNKTTFENSFVILTKNVFNMLEKNNSITSYHKGFYRLKYEPDYSYPGGLVTLKAFNHANYYLVENMDFPFFKKIFSVKDFPNAIHFIIK